MRHMIALILAALALVTVPASAQTPRPDPALDRQIELKNLVRGKARIDPAKAYIFIRSPGQRTHGTFLKAPSPDEIASHEAWARRNPLEARREPLELSMLVVFGPNFVFDKTDGPDRSFTYLIEVEPGEYTYLGPMFPSLGVPTFGDCYCMGSVKFEAKAGLITSLGDFLSLGWADREALMQADIYYQSFPDRPPTPTDWSVPESLAQYPHAKAELRAAGKRNNFLNALVSRIPPVPGVLAYDRDAVIDLVAQAESGAGTTPSAAADAIPATSPASGNESNRLLRGRSEGAPPFSKLRKDSR